MLGSIRAGRFCASAPAAIADNETSAEPQAPRDDPQPTTWWSAILPIAVAAILLSVAAPAATFAQVVPPNPPCNNVTDGGATVTCSGNVSPGIAIAFFPITPFQTLNVNSLTAEIAPASGNSGITFQSSGNVTLNNNPGSYGITVTGANAIGIDAQSINGTVTINNAGRITTLGTGATGIGAGAGVGPITITNTGTISGSGDNSTGIQADSTHGLVNAAPISVVNHGTIIESGTGSNAVGLAGNIGLTSFFNGPTGVVAANGNNSIGVAAAICNQVFPGSTDCIPSASAGSIEVRSLGRIQAIGANSYGIIAFAFGSGGSININLGEGSVTLGGSGDKTFGVSPAPGSPLFTGSAAIAIVGGTGTTLTNAGTITAASGQAIVVVEGTYPFGTFVGANTAIDNTATGRIIGDITLGAGNDTIKNAGQLTGNVDMGGGVNVFTNAAGGTFFMGPTVNLGASNTLTNSGTLMAGTSGGPIQTTALTGNLAQTSTGKLLVDINLTTGQASRIDVSGTATLAGTVVVNTINFSAPGAGLNQSFTILSAANGATNAGLAVTPSSPALQATLLYPNATDVVLATAINFAFGGLTSNQTAIGNYLNAAVAAGGGGVGPVLNSLLGMPSVATYQAALNQLSPEVFSQTALASLYASQMFGSNMLSCRVNGNDGAAIIREGQCVWVRGRTQYLDVAASSTNPGFKDRTDSISGGTQLAIAPDWRVGFAIGYDHTITQTDPNARSQGDRVSVGSVIKYNPGSVLLAATVLGGWGSYNTTRAISFGGFNTIATSNNDVDFLAGRLHASYLFDLGGWYLKPLVDGGPTRIYRGGFAESAGGGAGLVVQGSSDTVWNVSPALEVGSQVRLGDGFTWRPFVRSGVTWNKPVDFAVTAGFAGAPAGIAPFTVNTKFDNLLADIGAGLDIISADGAAVRLQYDGRFGEDIRLHSFGLKGSIPF